MQPFFVAFELFVVEFLGSDCADFHLQREE